MKPAYYSLRKHLVLVLGFLISLCTNVKAELYKLSISKLAEASSNVDLLLQPETIIDSQLSLEGDEFVAQLSPVTARALKLPRATKLIGHIISFNDSGSLIEIDALLLANQQKVAAKGSIKLDASTNIASSSVRASTELAAATLVGAVDAIEYGGIATALMTNGISVGVGATLGLAAGLTGLANHQVKPLRVDGFQATKMRLVSDLELLEPLPSAEMLDAAEEYRSRLDKISERMALTKPRLGLDLKLKDIDTYFSSSYGEFIILEIEIDNKTSRTIYPQDLVVVSSRHLKPVYSNPLIYSDGLDPVRAGEHRVCKLAYGLGQYDDSHRYQLKLLDPRNDQVLLSYSFESLRASR